MGESDGPKMSDDRQTSGPITQHSTALWTGSERQKYAAQTQQSTGRMPSMLNGQSMPAPRPSW